MDTFLSCKKECILGEAHIIADSESKGGVFSLKGRKLGRSWADIVALEECDSTWNVYIEKMLLAVSRRDFTLFIET